MKKLILLAVMVMATIAAPAQLFKKAIKDVEPQYAQGTVPVINGKVTFEEAIPATELTSAQIYEITQEWVKERFVEPTVLSKKEFQSENPNSIVLKGEEYLVFKNKFLVLERARIYYFLTLTANDGSCTFNMSRITYWYDEEEDKGGLKMKAEDWITDENAFNKKGELKPFESKFRCKTIDLKDILVNDLKKKLNSK
ncbi:MAG: DUF4468 domain-containing protein [Bacteroidaceae bacterium]|nr:DUF4468 domain-containing protein [Bacteroidaceae bacterium]